VEHCDEAFMSKDPFDNLDLAPEQVASLLAKQSDKAAPPVKRRLKKTDEGEWAVYRYTDQMNLARISRNALIAVQAELHHLWFKALNKTKPVALSNVALKAFGFHRSDKVRALRALEEAGMVTVQWRGKKSPLVTLKRAPPM
jgi:hypothetical protein